MRSPFPGLDPYLQKFWPSVHHRLITYAGDILVDRLPGALNLFIEQRIVFETDETLSGPPLRGYVPDIAVVESELDLGSSAPESESGVIAVAEPLTIRFPAQPISEAYIEIRDAATGGQIITTIELLSPSNKMPGPSRDAFLQKQADMRAGNVSLVEIDLVRGGDWVLTLPQISVKREAQTELRISIIRGWVHDLSLFYPIKLNQRLPTIPIPLRRTDEPLTLDLQALFDLCYERGRYGDLIDYSKDPMPPLDTENKRWVEDLLRQSGKRN